jgi:hypothetical protein
MSAQFCPKYPTLNMKSAKPKEWLISGPFTPLQEYKQVT